MDLIIIFPNSLFKNNELIRKYSNNADICIIEHPVYFTHYDYHKLKLILHRASMKNYFDTIIKDFPNISVTYVEYNKYEAFIKRAIKKYDHFVYYDPCDHIITDEFSKYNIETIVENTPLFIADIDKINEYNEIVGDKSFIHINFYKWMRKEYSILMKNDKPVGNKWSFDTSNRNPYPSNINTNDKKMYKPKSNDNKYVIEAKKYIEKHFSRNPGKTEFYLPIDHRETINHFKIFLKNRLLKFGKYQDAVNSNIDIGYHSVLSPMLNIGLITPLYVIKKVELYGNKYKVPTESVEGFIRQVLGWREIMRLIYFYHNDKMETSNYFNHRRKLNKSIWYKIQDSTGFKVIDDCLDKVNDIGYLHHIERLMYIGNYFILNKIDPHECYDWFMTFFVDSYNWVMSGNVYAMSQYSTGKFLMTRPYFSSSNYIAKMSDYKKKKYKISLRINKIKTDIYWDKIWDSLYYKFINDNYDKLKHNYATAYQVAIFEKKSPSEKNEYINIAKAYMKYY